MYVQYNVMSFFVLENEFCFEFTIVQREVDIIIIYCKEIKAKKENNVKIKLCPLLKPLLINESLDWRLNLALNALYYLLNKIDKSR